MGFDGFSCGFVSERGFYFSCSFLSLLFVFLLFIQVYWTSKLSTGCFTAAAADKHRELGKIRSNVASRWRGRRQVPARPGRSQRSSDVKCFLLMWIITCDLPATQLPSTATTSCPVWCDIYSRRLTFTSMWRPCDFSVCFFMSGWRTTSYAGNTLGAFTPMGVFLRYFWSFPPFFKCHESWIVGVWETKMSVDCTFYNWKLNIWWDNSCIFVICNINNICILWLEVLTLDDVSSLFLCLL